MYRLMIILHDRRYEIRGIPTARVKLPLQSTDNRNEKCNAVKK
jgi:hypothetical protein